MTSSEAAPEPLGEDGRVPALRVMHLMTRGSGGGSEKHVRGAVDVERDCGDQVQLAVGVDSNFAGIEGLVVHRLKHLRRGLSLTGDIRALIEIRALLRHHPVDVLYTHEAKAALLGRLAGFRKTRVTIFTIHGASFGPTYPRFASLLFRLAEFICAPLTDYYISVGRELIDLYTAARIAPPHKFVLIRSPIALDDFLAVRAITDVQRIMARKESNLTDRKVVLTASRLESGKRVDLLIRELLPLLCRGQYLLLVAGDGPESTALKLLCDELNIQPYVRFLGNVTDLPRFMVMSDVFVLTSRNEGVSQVILQALASGLPVVATRVPGLHEVPGAEVKVISRTGRGLSAAVELAVAHPPRPVEVTAFNDWSDAAIRQDRLRFRQRIVGDMASGNGRRGRN